MKQYIYNVDTIKKNFLASYADTIIKGKQAVSGEYSY